MLINGEYYNAHIEHYTGEQAVEVFCQVLSIKSKTRECNPLYHSVYDAVIDHLDGITAYHTATVEMQKLHDEYVQDDMERSAFIVEHLIKRLSVINESLLSCFVLNA